MSDISATNCGCGCDQEVTRNFGCFGGGNNCCSIIWILLLLNCFCSDNWNGGGCGCGSGNDNSCMWIILLLLFCGGGCGGGCGCWFFQKETGVSLPGFLFIVSCLFFCLFFPVPPPFSFFSSGSSNLSHKSYYPQLQAWCPSSSRSCFPLFSLSYASFIFRA